jgi:hypothetical protein
VTGTALWVTVGVASALCFGLKLAGWALPSSWLAHPRLAPIAGLVTVALLSGLFAVQTFAQGTALVVDARLPAVVVAAIALWRRVPFIVVVILAAAVAAALRALGWCV